MQSPSRPFESLDWFREASRREYRAGSPLRQALRWLKSSRCFAFHIGLFALGLTIALAINVARTPDEIWADRLAFAWILLLVIHAVVVSLIFAVGLLGSNEEELPIYMPPGSSRFGQPGTNPAPAPAAPAAPAWPAPPPPRTGTEPATETAPPVTTPQPAPGWGRRDQASAAATSWGSTTPAPSGETASWREATPAAWLRRRRPDATGITTPPAPTATSTTTTTPETTTDAP